MLDDIIEINKQIWDHWKCYSTNKLFSINWMKIYGGKSYILKETQETSLATTIYEPYMDSNLKSNY